MLEGFGHVHTGESKTSAEVFAKFVDHMPRLGRALEAGGGIGRISKTILYPMGFEKIDLQDQSPK